MSKNFNLWGDPEDPPGETRGRPSHAPTDARRSRVTWLRSLNFTDAMIAAAFGITEPTLRKHYRLELQQGKAQKRAQILVTLAEKAATGNVTAIRAYLHEMDKADLMPERRQREAKAPKIGKKEQAALDAARVDSGTSVGELLLRRAGDVVH